MPKLLSPACYAEPEKFIKNWSRFTKRLPLESPFATNQIPFQDSVTAFRDICSEYLDTTAGVDNALPEAERRAVLTRNFDQVANNRRYDANRQPQYLRAIENVFQQVFMPKRVNDVLFEHYFGDSCEATFVVTKVITSVEFVAREYHTLSSLNGDYGFDEHVLMGPVPAVRDILIEFRPLTGVSSEGTFDAAFWSNNGYNLGNSAYVGDGIYRLQLSQALWHVIRATWKLSRLSRSRARNVFGTADLLPLTFGLVPAMFRRLSMMRWCNPNLAGKFVRQVVDPGLKNGFNLF